MGLFSFLFKNRDDTIDDYLRKGAVILDVRTKKEYQSEHINGSILIPLVELKSRLNEVKKLDKPVIAHCKSGIRSAQATQLLKSYGIDAINGGGIAKLKNILKQ